MTSKNHGQFWLITGFVLLLTSFVSLSIFSMKESENSDPKGFSGIPAHYFCRRFCFWRFLDCDGNL